MKSFVLIAALTCVLPRASMAQRYTVYGKPGVTGSYTRIGLGQGFSGPVCGPPNFNCSSQSSAVASVPTLPTMAAINSTGYAYSSPTDFFYPSSGKGNCYTALSDATQRGGVSLHASLSGGGGNLMSDINRSYRAGTDENGALFYYHVHYDVNGCMQMDSDMSKTSPSGGTQGGFTFSRVTGGRAYKVSPKDGTHSALYQEDLSGTSTITVTRTLLFDYNNCPGVDGTLTTQGGNGNLNVDYLDRFYSTSLNFPPATNGQDGAHWVFVWDRTTNSCATYYTGVVQNTENPANGNIWSWCTGNCSRHGSNPAPLALNTQCDPLGYGVHNTIGITNGLYMNISGKCINGAAGGTTVWRYGQNELRSCHQTLNNCGGHGANGFSTFWQVNNNISHRSVTDLTTWDVIHALPPNGIDQHGGTQWIGAANDRNPWLTSSHPNTLSNSCSTNPYCYELMAIRLDGVIVRFGPNFHQWTGAANDLGPILAADQDGYCMVFESSWNGTRGTDSNGNLRKDLFSLCNLQ